MDWAQVGIGAVALIVTVLGVRWAVPRLGREIKNRDQSGTIKRLDDTLTAETHAREAMERLHAQEIAGLKAEHGRCREELAEMRGQLAVFTGDFADRIIAAIEAKT